MSSLKILSYNIHKGFSLSQKYVLQLMREALRSTDADVVFLQEVLGHHRRLRGQIKGWPSASQFEFLADSHWHHFAYGKNAIYSGGHHGNAILSKFPIIKWSNLDISNSRLERRGLLYGRIEHPTGPLHSLCLHLDLLPRGQRTQLELISNWIKGEIAPDEPLIIAGDFNDWSSSATASFAQDLGLKEAFFETNGQHARTFPSLMPVLRLDRIYLRQTEIQAVRCLRGDPWKSLSDHVPLFAEIILAPAATAAVSNLSSKAGLAQAKQSLTSES